MKIICTYLYIPSHKKNVFVKKILAYSGYSPTSPFFLLLSEHKHCNNRATNSNSETLQAEWWQVCRGMWVRGQRMMTQVLGTYGQLDFTILRPVLTWRAFWKLQTIYFFNFHNRFQAVVNRGILKPQILNPLIGESACINLLTSALNGSKWSNPHFSHFSPHPPPPKKAPWYPLTRIGGNQTQPGHFGELKNPLSLPSVKPKIIQPTAHHYTTWAIWTICQIN